MMETIAAQDIEGPQEMACLEKTPIQILHEYGMKVNSAPIFEMEKAEGSPHQPYFLFSVTVGEIKCRGEGNSKKAAKHEAAEAALKILQMDPLASRILQGPTNEHNDVDDQKNPVGILQELAQQRLLRPPEYVVVMETGPCHNKKFSVTCRLEDMIETGHGSSKKMAKKEAAERILEKFQSLSENGEIAWTPKPLVYIESFRHSTSVKISELRRNLLSNPNVDYVQVMQDLAREQGFDVIFHSVDELTVNGQFQCLVQLSTVPVTVCHGTGITVDGAQNNAAHSALQYIKIMCTMK